MSCVGDMDILALYLDRSDPFIYSLIAIPVIAVMAYFLEGWRRYAAIIAFTLLPTILFLVFVRALLPWMVFQVDFSKTTWIWMGLIIVLAYNLFWLLPAFLGFLLGNLAMWVKLHQSK